MLHTRERTNVSDDWTVPNVMNVRAHTKTITAIWVLAVISNSPEYELFKYVW